jgi:hypothetical protein
MEAFVRPPQLPLGTPAITVTAPITVQAPPPALVSSDVGAEHVGCTRAALAEHLGWMTRSPKWSARVIEASRKRRFAAPADIIASMRDRYADGRAETRAAANDSAAPSVDDVLAEIGHARRPVPARRGSR